MATGIHAQFATGRNDRLAQDLEAAQSSQGEAEIDFFADKILLVESPAPLEVFARAKKKRARTEIQAKIDRAEAFHENAAPTRNIAIDQEASAPTGITVLQCVDDIDNVSCIDAGIGVDKAQDASARAPPAGVARRRDMAPINRNNLRAGLPGNIGRRVGRGIIDHNDLVILVRALRGRVNGGDGCGKFHLFVVGGNDEGNHKDKIDILLCRLWIDFRRQS